MKAIIFKEIGAVALAERETPRLQDSEDAIVRVTASGICGSDLHIVYGRDEGEKCGTIMGHEFTGIIEETGSGVQNLRNGDRIVSPFTVNCGKCFYCLRDLPARCLHSRCFGFVSQNGEGLEGAQAEYVRVPLASSTLVKIPEGINDEEIIFLGDIFSTAYSCAENANIKQGDVVIVVGCGPVGLLGIMAAQAFQPSRIIAVDSIDYRLEKARSFGAITARPNPDGVAKMVRNMTDGRGADAILEAVGNPSALDLAIQAARPGATVSIAGYHTEPFYKFPIHLAYTKNLTVKIGRCNARKYMTQLLPLIAERRFPLTDIITHVLPLSEGVRGYEIFDKRLESAIKVLLKP
jgi:2-desacetyl-2-hydroxyethyl bacteriochlorophyllide A dehydrogenase